MYNSFISIVGVLKSPEELKTLPIYLDHVYQIAHQNFTDFEIILVNNAIGVPIHAEIADLSPKLKQNVYLLNLSSPTNKSNAILAGLDRSNGDYTIIFELDLYKQPEIILDLFRKTKDHFDIVYLRSKQRKHRAQFKFFYKIFYFIIKRYSSLRIDKNARDTRIISRRSLNSLLRLRENLRYMKAIYSLVGYPTTFIEMEVDVPEEKENFSSRFRTSLIAITSYTTFLRSLLLWIFIFSLVFLFGVIVNALKVKFTNVDLLGNVGPADSGWTFLVILISIFFATTCLNLYIMSIYLSNIYQEIKRRPLYIIESIQRF